MLSRRSLLAAALGSPQIQLRLDANAAQVQIESGKIRTAFHYGERWAKPFLYPLLSPSGAVLSRGFPLEERAGESTDHAWHRGLWIGHGDINGFDFWREVKPESTGRLRVQGQPRLRPQGFAVKTLLLPPQQQKAIGELQQEWRFFWHAQGFCIDVHFRYRAGEPAGLQFADTDDGGFGMRLRDEFREDRGAVLQSDDGRRGSKALWGQAARWIDYSAKVEGQTAGVTMFDHPGNLRYPTEWHARPYGLNAANPFAHRSFQGKNASSGAYTLPAGRKLDLRYRVLWHDGLGEPQKLAEAVPKS